MDFVIGRYRVREPLAVADHLFPDEDVDVRSQAAALVANVKTDARRESFQRLHNFACRRCIDNNVLALELGEERVQVARQVDSRHGGFALIPDYAACQWIFVSSRCVATNSRGFPASCAAG